MSVKIRKTRKTEKLLECGFLEDYQVMIHRLFDVVTMVLIQLLGTKNVLTMAPQMCNRIPKCVPKMDSGVHQVLNCVPNGYQNELQNCSNRSNYVFL